MDAPNFLEDLARLPADTFESRFSKVAVELGLGALFDGNELKLLYDAALCASLCNLAFNGSEASGGEIRPEHEAQRRKLEGDFMVAREIFWASPGWQTLSDSEREPIEQHFLRVLVAEEKLAR
jgi:hypothetical protein